MGFNLDLEVEWYKVPFVGVERRLVLSIIRAASGSVLQEIYHVLVVQVCEHNIVPRLVKLKNDSAFMFVKNQKPANTNIGMAALPCSRTEILEALT